MKIRYDRPQVWWQENLNRLRVFTPNEYTTLFIVKCFSDYASYENSGSVSRWGDSEYRAYCCYHSPHLSMRELVKAMKQYDRDMERDPAIFLGNL